MSEILRAGEAYLNMTVPRTGVAKMIGRAEQKKCEKFKNQSEARNTTDVTQSADFDAFSCLRQRREIELELVLFLRMRCTGTSASRRVVNTAWTSRKHTVNARP